MADAGCAASDAGSKASSATGSVANAAGSAESAIVSAGSGSVIGSAIVMNSSTKDNAVVPAANVDKRKSIGLMSCWFECGTQQNQVKLQNIGTERCPKMVCPACNSSRRAMERQGR